MSSSGDSSQTESGDGEGSETNGQGRYLEVIDSISNALGKALDGEQLLKTALERIVEATDATSGVVYAQSEDGMWELVASVNLPGQMVASHGRITGDYPGIKLVLENDIPVTYSERITEPSQFVSDLNKENGLQSWAAVKISLRDRLYGVLAISSQEYEAFRGPHLQVMGVIGQLVSLALSNAAAHENAFTQVDNQLQERTAIQESVLASMSDGLLICDKEGRILRANQAAVRITGIPLDQLMGQSVLSEIWNHSPDDSEEQYEPGHGPLARAVLHGEECENCYIQTSTRDRQCVLSVSVSILRTVERLSGGAVIVMRDVTEEWEAQRSNEEFLNILSHELRAPLTVISGYAQFLSRKLAKQGMDDDRQSADLIREHALRMSAMIGAIVESGRLEAGMRGVEKEPTDLAELVRNVVRRINAEQRYTRKEPETTIATSIEPGLPEMQIDKGRMDQVLTNLLANAVKYGPDGDEIVVSVTTQGAQGKEHSRVSDRTSPQSVLISVTDRGVGVPVEEREHIFKRGYRGKRGKDLSAQGLGLGLYICRLAVEAHGGHMGVKDGPGGKGSTFWIILPVESSD